MDLALSAEGAEFTKVMPSGNAVPKEGLEPSHPKAQEPKSCVSTSSTTPAVLIASLATLATLARRGSRVWSAYFVVAPGRKACPVAPPQHGAWARSGFDCSARWRSLRGIAPLERAYFVVARGRKACPLPPPQHGAWARSGLIASFASLKSAMKFTDGDPASVCRRDRLPSRCTGRPLWCLCPSCRRQ
jgi:hypothetical protein